MRIIDIILSITILISSAVNTIIGKDNKLMNYSENLVGHYTEIMPGRPTISEHRCPADNIRNFVDFKTAELITKLDISIITAAEQQTMNYYMNIAGFYTSDIGITSCHSLFSYFLRRSQALCN